MNMQFLAELCEKLNPKTADYKQSAPREIKSQLINMNMKNKNKISNNI